MNIGEYSPIGVMVKDYNFSLFGQYKGNGINVLQNLWASIDCLKLFFSV